MSYGFHFANKQTNNTDVHLQLGGLNCAACYDDCCYDDFHHNVTLCWFHKIDFYSHTIIQERSSLLFLLALLSPCERPTLKTCATCVKKNHSQLHLSLDASFTHTRNVWQYDILQYCWFKLLASIQQMVFSMCTFSIRRWWCMQIRVKFHWLLYHVGQIVCPAKITL